ncbi:methylated-DNA--[protein]-cysteine S-methyltransferase [Pseudooceanicola sediminis]|uniref:Methylated-DNA--protein-cysteine methyltransferase n=1 Tax=Pseudooceanicola sediminis TaxID=2211117 RepID=A0A399J1Y5_9RHOB|nr:methylated-DNA--[protein]-cysteine S-methyltransferase [Pseudooceanicola sediminis]KAA2313828.1 methylated-DNA--[protein]-cysteine S-methyltransferase [Puniceibacterium sp. HSS470]RII38647.1 methylated-DNA--[protein]-cysteine S-methyltransferase [Pseudooceanicola sediminis]|tara:strand:+ start:3706 stop:4173 length:468 start_codon:yes stop_codon:yes gene_type:complete
MPTACLDTPTGPLRLTEEDGAITRLSWCLGQADLGGPAPTPLLATALNQLRAYFAGTLRTFDLPLRVAGSDLQRAVCTVMQGIPYGETMTYGDIARRLDRPAQAIGQACGGNPIPVIIPCHRVLGANGLGGFSGQGGVETKIALLRLEGAASLLI